MNDLQRRLASLSPAQRALLEQKLGQVEKPLPQTPSVQAKRRTDRSAVLSFAQQSLWFLDQLLAGSPVYNIPAAFRLSGFLDIRCLEQGLNAVIARHEVLRTTIESVEGKPFQIVGESRLLELVVHDLSVWSEVEREAEALRLLAQDAQRPFNLARDLMLRATVIRLAGEEHILLVVMHHIASDGWSMGVLMRELSHFYEAEISGCPGSLPELPIQYADYAEWQLEWLQGKVLSGQLDYWKQQLAGVPTRLDLPTDRPRPAVQTFRGASRQLELSPELTQGLKALGLREKASLFMTLLAAFQVLLFRYTGQDDIVLGFPIAGRNRGEVEELIGFFVNTLALRTDLSGDPTFLDVLRRVREVALNAYDHQDLPFERLVEELQSERSLSHNPLFQVMFALQNAPSSPLKLSGLQASPMRLVTETTHFDLTLSITERRSGLIGRLSYSTDLFDAATIERMLGHFEVLLEGILTRPQERISRLPLLKETERRQLEEWNRTISQYPRDWDLPALFEAQVERRPTAVAVVCKERQVTYLELNQKANKLAHYLRKRGVGPEVLVGFSMNRSEDMVVGLLGILKAGGAYVPLDLTYPSERLKYMIRDTGITVVLTEQVLLEGILKSNIVNDLETICLDRDWSLVSRESEANPKPLGTAETLAYVMYTSGSTGQPKGVGIPQRAVSRLVLEANYARFGEDEVFLQMAPTSFDASTFELWGALLNGSRCVLYPGWLPNLKNLGQQIERHGVTTLWLTAALFNTVIDDAPEILRPIRQLLIGGEALSVTHVLRANERLPNTQIINGYGPTENTTFTCCHTIPKVLGASRSIPIGTAIANTRVYLLDRYLNPVPVGVVGELYTGGDGLARGYWGRADLTAERFVPNPFGQTEGERLYRTGDLARYLPDGNIEFLGRIDNQVKIRGFRIELGEIEATLGRHESVEQAVVICPEDRGEKRLVAYFTVSRDETSITELRNFLKNQLPEYMVPAVFVRLDKLPLAANGKVDRRALPKPVGLEGPEGNDYCPPRDRLELQLAEIWESLLHVEHAGVTDNFFDLGGHSLLAVKLLAQINQSFGRNLPLVSVFQAPTVEQMANLLRQQGWKPLGESLVVVQPNGSMPPFFCVHGIVGCPRLAAYLGQDQPLYGLVQGLDGNRFFTRVEDLAAHYLKDIKMICPQGPYLLGGYSFGGLVAFEMAQQLSRAGEEVGLLALIDPTTPRDDHQQSSTEDNSNSRRQSSSERLGTRILRHLRQLREFPRATRVAYLRGRFGMMMTLAGNKGKRLTCEIYLRLGWSMPPAFRTFYIGEVLFGAHYLVASKAYRTEPFEGRAVLIHTRRKGAFDPEEIWRQLIPNELTSYVMPGDHFEILREPLIGILAGYLRDCLEQVHETNRVRS